MSTISSSTTSGSAILTALGGSSQIDTGALVTSLVSATYDPKTAALKTKQDANTAKVSQLATLTAGIDSFSTALGSLISGGTLFTQPTSSDSAVLTATAKPGASIGSLSSQLSVRQIAQAQSLVSGYYVNSATAVGTGTLTLVNGGQPFSVTIDSTNNSLAGVARAINASGSGVTASVVTDANGARLTLKGATGAANAFQLAVSPGSDGSLAKLAYGISNGMTISGNAAVSVGFADETASPTGQGSFALTGPGGTANVTIDASNDNLDGLAAAINAANVGLTAAVASDGNGSYHLSITDGSGNAPSYTLTPASDAQAGLARFTWPAPASSGMTLAQSAQDAIVRMDGVDITRGSNVVDDLIDGVTLTLKTAAPTETVSLTATRPTDAIKQAVGDFVAAYNEMKAELTTATAVTTNADGTTTQGALYGNSAIRQMQTQLSRLTSTILNTSGGPQTLADIGVSTNRDGTLALDDSALTKALTSYPDAVEAMFNPTQHASSPLIRITSAIGAVTPGTYTLSNIVAQTGSVSASGTIDGSALVTTGGKLYASVSSKASGLTIEPQGDVASATVTVDLGLGGALKAIRDSLRSSGGILDSLSTQLTSEKTDLADQATQISDDQTNYEQRLTTQFATMNTQVANYTAIKSYLTQQIAVWTKSN